MCHRSACPTVLVQQQRNTPNASKNSNGARYDSLNSNVYPVSFPLSATIPNCIRCYPLNFVESNSVWVGPNKIRAERSEQETVSTDNQFSKGYPTHPETVLSINHFSPKPFGDRELFCTAGQAGPWHTEPRMILQSTQPDQPSACHRSACPTVLVQHQKNTTHAPESDNGTRNDSLNSNGYPVSFPLSPTTPNCIRCYPEVDQEWCCSINTAIFRTSFSADFVFATTQ